MACKAMSMRRSPGGLAALADLACQYLSAGQKKRLALARLKSSDRPLWLLDEPLAALDTSGKKSRAESASRRTCAIGGIVDRRDA